MDSYGYGMGADMYNGMGDMCNQGYGNMGTMDRFGNVRYTKAQIIQGIRDYIIGTTNIMISREQKLEETPQLLRHACAEAGISQLSVLMFPVPEMGLQVPFYFCTACGKLFYPQDFM